MKKDDKYDDDYYTNSYHADFKPRVMFQQMGDVDFDFDAMVAESEARIAATVSAGEPVLLTPLQLAKIEEIRWMHDTALTRALIRDGHSKSGEGNLAIGLGNYRNRVNGEVEVSVDLYAYVLGPHRSHHFATIDRALETVRIWYAQEMATSEEAADFFYDEQLDDPTNLTKNEQ